MQKHMILLVPNFALSILLCVIGLGPMLAEGGHHEKITQPIGDLVRVWEVEGPLPLPLQPPSRIPPFSTPTTPLEEVNYIAAQFDFNVTPQTIVGNTHSVPIFVNHTIFLVEGKLDNHD